MWRWFATLLPSDERENVARIFLVVRLEIYCMAYEWSVAGSSRRTNAGLSRSTETHDVRLSNCCLKSLSRRSNMA